MKRVNISAEFPDLKGNIYRSGVATASTTRAAIARAFESVLGQVKGKHISTIKSTISISEVKGDSSKEAV